MKINVANPIYDSVFKYLMEDEYFQAIENRDTAIMNRDRIIAEKDTQIAEMDLQIAEMDIRIAEKDTQITLFRTMLQSMLNSGMNMESMAGATGLSEDKIRELLAQ